MPRANCGATDPESACGDCAECRSAISAELAEERHFYSEEREAWEMSYEERSRMRRAARDAGEPRSLCELAGMGGSYVDAD